MFCLDWLVEIVDQVNTKHLLLALLMFAENEGGVDGIMEQENDH